MPGVSWESVKEKLDRREDEERGQEYLQRLDEEEVAENRMMVEQEIVSLNDEDKDEDKDEEMEIDMEVADEVIAEFCKELEEEEEVWEDEKEKSESESEPAKKKRNMMKIPYITLMALKNNTGDQEAADLATGQF